ncbi:helix-turn-helix domain-containing protein [Actinokineospora sp. NBRC 105648]|uniref:AraC family transcriptional regulator n=1 Tax=Actinokineospora sp. NBRC 105648 TaxID=3032206 RepID=UPI0024A501FD|nr:helix-turn-helix domain-containing protein [Actinokineospora sp. NBRC 105648]GLZ41131.1 hypothetical protein Acsp05_47550 [Actinokineospora sp. NBRC 105648]
MPIDRVETVFLDPGRPLIHLPDPATTLVWRTADEEVLVVGPRTHATYHHGKELPPCVRMRLRLGRTVAVLGVPAVELVDRVVPLSELWGRDRITGLGGLSATSGRARIEAALRARANSAQENAVLVHRAASALARHTEVPAVARGLGVSERRLRDLFTVNVGLSPKRFASLSRIRRVLSAFHREPLADLAVANGFYDQSHMGADFRRLMRVTPTAFRAGRLPTTTCTG